MASFILEGCVDSVESAVIATGAGANRLELCSNLMIGGTTPTAAFFNEVRRSCENKINVLIRPRFGDFCYSDYEFRIIRGEVRAFRKLGADGVVIGILQPDGNLNMEKMGILMEEAGDMSVTLHRAFDVSAHPFKTLEQAVDLGIDTILTSGQKNSCLEGKECLKELVQKSAGRIDIMAGGGTCAAVIEELYPYTGVTSWHMSGKRVLDSAMTYRKAEVHMGLDSISEYDIWQTDGEKIRKAKGALERVLTKRL